MDITKASLCKMWRCFALHVLSYGSICAFTASSRWLKVIEISYCTTYAILISMLKKFDDDAIDRFCFSVDQLKIDDQLRGGKKLQPL